MKPGIRQSIKAGFQAANGSWPAMALFAGAWGVAILVAFGGILLTKPPQEELQRLSERQDQEALVREEPLLDEELDAEVETPAPEAADAIAPAEQPAATEAAPTLGDLATADVPVAAPIPAAPARVQSVEDEEDRIVGAWVARAWPVLALCALVLLGVSLWTNGGQIGYLSQRLLGTATLAEFLAAGKRAFVPLLLTWLLSAALLAASGLVMALSAALAGALATVLPEAVVGILSFLTASAMVAALIWASVRLSFWFIAVVVDRLGPVAGLKQSWRATRGRWWRVLGLGAALTALSAAVWIAFVIPAWAGALAGGPVALVGGLVTALLRLAAGLYFGFFGLAASIRFYADAKSDATAPAAPGA